MSAQKEPIVLELDSTEENPTPAELSDLSKVNAQAVLKFFDGFADAKQAGFSSLYRKAQYLLFVVWA